VTYEKKFAGLLAAIAEAKSKGAECLVVALPEALGDDYGELIESLNRIAAADLALHIVPPERRTPADEAGS
jgi:hypothetical protein